MEERSIFSNPKTGFGLIRNLKTNNALLTGMWRNRLIRYYKNIIPSNVDRAKQIWLTTSEEINSFYKGQKEGTHDLSEIEYVCISEAISDVYDIIDHFSLLRAELPDHARLIFTNFNWLWSPLFYLSGLVGLSRKRDLVNFYREGDLNCFLDMAGWEVVKQINGFFIPFRIPIIGTLFDNILAKLPGFRNFVLNNVTVARKRLEGKTGDYSVSVLIPCKNEEDNIRACVKRVPKMGTYTELVFINDKSTDSTENVIKNCIKEFPDKNIVLAQGKGLGKGEAVACGMEKAAGDICMILDADLTVMPEDLPQFYEAIRLRRADFIHGTRLVYAQENDSMRFFNLLGNIMFSILFTYIIGERTTDTLCGTKVYWRRDWPLFMEMKNLLKKSDMWGDYQLIFGAARFNLKIAQLPVRYYERLQGTTKMNKRLRNGLIMLRITWYAFWKVKFFGFNQKPS
ncbi:MAG: glycosyl transferase [bacterium]|nr:MAG: glycosyl transferase [bacterium]